MSPTPPVFAGLARICSQGWSAATTLGSAAANDLKHRRCWRTRHRFIRGSTHDDRIIQKWGFHRDKPLDSERVRNLTSRQHLRCFAGLARICSQGWSAATTLGAAAKNELKQPRCWRTRHRFIKASTHDDRIIQKWGFHRDKPLDSERIRNLICRQHLRC